MALDSQHPSYSNFVDIWTQVIDTYKGERAVKDKGTDYLPATSGQIADGQGKGESKIGQKAYVAYKLRAIFPEIYKDAVKAAIGLMHRKPPIIELPTQMEPLRESATVEGESLNLLLRKINEAQLRTGRVGLLPDMPIGEKIGTVMPHIAIYPELCITNWDDGGVDRPVLQNLNLVVLDEGEYERDTNLDWKYVRKFRVLVLGDATLNEGKGKGKYAQGLFVDDGQGSFAFTEAGLMVPQIQGNALDFIPFTFINATDLLPEPDYPPLLGLSNLTLTIYRGEADYRQSLFMQGQDTLVIKGGRVDPDTPIKVGATGRIDVGKDGDAKYIGVSSDGLKEQREALRNDRNDAREIAGKLLDSISKQKEAAETLKIRVAAQTATLNQVTLAGAEGLQTQLRYIAMWLGLDPEKVIVTPNLDFAGGELTGKDLTELQQAKNQGAPISQETIHSIMKKHDVTTFEYEEELDKITEEEPLTQGNNNNNLDEDEAFGNDKDEDEDEDEDEDS